MDNLVSVISKFNNGSGPDVLGVCEIENNFVIDLLVQKLIVAMGRNYGFVLSDGQDKRGIDTALIFDKAYYTSDAETYSLRIIKRNSTRDLFQVHLNTINGNKLICILNHWPSRSGGELQSEPYRIMVAENLAYWIERINEEQGDDVAILLMGDFNDNPYNRSIIEYLLANNNRAQVKSNQVKNKYMYNLMYKFLDSQFRTYVYGSIINILDQFIVSKAILSERPGLPFKISTVDIIAYAELVKGVYKTPVKYGRPSSQSSYNPNGFSDHLPIELILNEN